MSLLTRYRDQSMKTRHAVADVEDLMELQREISSIRRSLPQGPRSAPGDAFTFQRGAVGVANGSGRTPFATFPTLTIDAGDPVAVAPVEVELSQAEYNHIVGQNVCSVLCIADELPQVLSQFRLTMRLDTGETFGGVILSPLNRLSGGITEPSLEMVLASQPQVPIQSRLFVSVTPIGPNVTLVEDLNITVQLATSHGGCF